MAGIPSQAGSSPHTQLQRPLPFLGVSMLSGVLLGILTLVGQMHLPDALLQLANSGAMWVIAAFVLGWYAPHWPVAILAGVLTLLSALVGYYGAAPVLVGVQTTLNALILWVGTALLAGPVMGAAGYSAHAAAGYRQSIAKAALGAVFLGEALYYQSIHQPVLTVAVFLAIACVITLIWIWQGPGRVNVILMTLGGGGAVFGGFLLLNIIDMLRAGIL